MFSCVSSYCPHALLSAFLGNFDFDLDFNIFYNFPCSLQASQSLGGLDCMFRREILGSYGFWALLLLRGVLLLACYIVYLELFSGIYSGFFGLCLYVI